MAKLPSVTINFKDAGDSAIDRAERGIVYLILQDESVTELTEVAFFNATDIPADYSEENKRHIKLALTGSYQAPRRVSAIVTPATEEFTIEGNEALALLATTDVDYFAIPDIAPGEATDVAAWVRQHNDSRPMRRLKAVLPNVVADNDHVINVTQEGAITRDDETLDAPALTPLVAGMRAGCPMQFSLDRYPTNALKYVPPVDVRAGQEAEGRVGDGEFLFNMDRGRVAVVADVNSLTELAGKDETYQQNKEIDIMDAFYNGLMPSIYDKYIGKFSNSYQNKLTLVSAIQAYAETFEQAGLVEVGDSDAEINFDAQRLFLKSINYRTFDDRTVDQMTEEEVLKANTKDRVFIRARFLPLGAIRQVTIDVLT